ncbi:MAG: site-specific DNA-methyltransferase [Porphyromonas sp.]|nr:site-specific DNA-methyltransferase [Porphyromonas sp.]
MIDKTITVYNLGNLPTAPLDAFHELQEDFKISDSDKLGKLQMLILTRGFKYSFKAWKDAEGRLWIIDAHQRRKALLALRKLGFDVPPIPYEPIFAATKKEAVEEIAAYNSEFAKKNPETILFERYEIDSDTMARMELPIEVYTVDVSPVSLAGEADTLQGSAALDSIDESPEDDYSGEAVTQVGDVWFLGRHKLMCGDCTKLSAVTQLMGGRKADLCVTDPPYNVAYTGATQDALTIANDDMTGNEFFSFLRSVFDSYARSMKEGAPIYVFHADSEGENFRRAFRESGFYLSQVCCWVKNSLVVGRQDYHWQHEPILYGWKSDGAHHWYSDRRQSTVWNFDKPQRSAIHPTMKPLPLMAYPIRNSSREGDLCIDFFSGSGSTLIACEQTSRQCYAMELLPAYVDASVRRFRALFPDEPVKLIRDGEEIAYTL